jgi:hypothetical protein
MSHRRRCYCCGCWEWSGQVASFSFEVPSGGTEPAEAEETLDISIPEAFYAGLTFGFIWPYPVWDNGGEAMRAVVFLDDAKRVFLSFKGIGWDTSTAEGQLEVELVVGEDTVWSQTLSGHSQFNMTEGDLTICYRQGVLSGVVRIYDYSGPRSASYAVAVQPFSPKITVRAELQPALSPDGYSASFRMHASIIADARPGCHECGVWPCWSCDSGTPPWQLTLMISGLGDLIPDHADALPLPAFNGAYSMQLIQPTEQVLVNCWNEPVSGSVNGTPACRYYCNRSAEWAGLGFWVDGSCSSGGGTWLLYTWNLSYGPWGYGVGLPIRFRFDSPEMSPVLGELEPGYTPYAMTACGASGGKLQGYWAENVQFWLGR